MSEAGKIYLFSMQFYDVKSGMMAFKARPALIMYGPRNNDYTVLPEIGRESCRERCKVREGSG